MDELTMILKYQEKLNDLFNLNDIFAISTTLDEIDSSDMPEEGKYALRESSKALWNHIAKRN